MYVCVCVCVCVSRYSTGLFFKCSLIQALLVLLSVFNTQQYLPKCSLFSLQNFCVSVCECLCEREGKEGQEREIERA